MFVCKASKFTFTIILNKRYNVGRFAIGKANDVWGGKEGGGRGEGRRCEGMRWPMNVSQ